MSWSRLHSWKLGQPGLDLHTTDLAFCVSFPNSRERSSPWSRYLLGYSQVLSRGSPFLKEDGALMVAGGAGWEQRSQGNSSQRLLNSEAHQQEASEAALLSWMIPSGFMGRSLESTHSKQPWKEWDQSTSRF